MFFSSVLIYFLFSCFFCLFFTFFFFLFLFFFFFIFFFFFFFSSRRRHTRLVSDWSSDCALPIFQFCYSVARSHQHSRERACIPEQSQRGSNRNNHSHYSGSIAPRGASRHRLRFHSPAALHRSEERRVGKGCRQRRCPDHEKKKER